MTGLDLRLALRGGLNGLVFVAPAAIWAETAADDAGEVSLGVAVGAGLLQLLGFCFAGWVVRRTVPSAAMLTCTAAGILCWAILQAAGIVTSLVRDEDLSPLTWVATGLLAAVVATLGGLLARVERVERPRPDPSEDPS